jgi:outer membrane protein insertion porin family
MGYIMRFFGAIVLFIFFSPLFAYCNDYSGMPIVAIEVEGVKTVKPDVLISLMGIEIGEPYNQEKIRQGIKRTFLKGIFEDIAVDAEKFEEGVKLRYLIKEKVFINRINFKGNELISSRKLRRGITLKEGDEYRREKLKDLEEEIKALYRKRGYRKTGLKVDVEEIGPYRGNLLIDIQEGQGTRVKGIEIKGEPFFEIGEILPLLRLKNGDILDIGQLDKGLEGVREFYRNNKYLSPEIGPPEIEYIDEEAFIKISIRAGLKVNIGFKGNTRFSSDRLINELPFVEEGVFSEEVIQDGVDRIIELYRKEGYYSCRISVDTKRSEDKKEIDITFSISEWEKLRIKSITFEGNSAVSSDKLKTLMTLKEEGIFTPGYFDDATLDKDLESIEDLYRGLGYLSAKAKGEITFNESRTEAFINISINEGIQSRVEGIEIEGSTVFSKEELLNALYLKKGMPYNDIDLGEDRYRILSLYSKKGYIYAEVDAKRTFSEDSSQAFISFKIYEGKPVTICKVIIRGNQDTKDKVIRRELLVRDGDLYDQEGILKSVQRVYRLGLFSQVRFEPVDTYRRLEKKDMLLTVKERKAGVLEFGMGYGDYDRFRGFIEVSHKNIGGYNRHISLRAEASSIEKRYALGFKEPWFLNNPVDFRASLLREEKRSINIETKETRYETRRIAGLAGIEKGITDTLKGSFLYQYEEVETFNIRPGAILTRGDIGTFGISSINPSIILDTRDDPFNPSSGLLSGLMLKFATRYFGSEVELYKITLQGGFYLKLWDGTVLALSGKGGLGRGFGRTDEVPIIERFFLGGRTTVRGYAQDTLGPKGPDGTPTGGNTLLLFNGELRFSLPKDFGLVGFVDAGNVWISPSSTKTTGLKYTVGIGLRYETPVGPLRLDYGHKIEREPGESRGELHFAIGHAF